MGNRLAVIIPWYNSGDPQRLEAFKFVKKNIESWGIAEIFIGKADNLNRAALRNNGAIQAIQAGYTKLFFNDADSLISKDQILKAIDLMDDDGVVYPYNRMPVHLNIPETKEVYKGRDFMAFSNLFSREIIPSAGNFGCSANTFTLLGGLDQAFRGYGYEDTDFAKASSRYIGRVRTVDGPLIELYHAASRIRGSEQGPVSIQGTNDWDQFEINKTRYQVKSSLDLKGWRAMANRPLLDIVVPVMRHGMAAKFMANTVFPVWAVVYNDEPLALEWTQAGANIIQAPGKTFAQKCNYAFKQLSSQYTLFVGEDVSFTKGWYEQLAKYSGYGVIGTNDLLYSNDLRSAHLIMSRDYVSKSGGSWGTKQPFYNYYHNFTDTEAIAKARAEGQWTYAPDIIIKHNHYESPDSGVEQDKVYKLGQASFNKDRETYTRRYKEYITSLI